MNKHEAGNLTEDVSNKVLKGAKVADKAVHQYPYRALSIAAGIGVVIGFVFGRRCIKDNA